MKRFHFGRVTVWLLGGLMFGAAFSDQSFAVALGFIGLNVRVRG